MCVCVLGGHSVHCQMLARCCYLGAFPAPQTKRKLHSERCPMYTRVQHFNNQYPLRAMFATSWFGCASMRERERERERERSAARVG